jgi:LysM repeat protein
MDENSPRESPSPIFSGLSPQIEPSSRRSRRRLIAAVAGALPIFAAASASWVVGATTLPALDPTQQPPVPPEPTPEELRDATSILGQQDHTVVEGETLTSIAQMHGIPTAALLALNGLSWQTSVHEGQVLVVSKQQRESASTSSAEMPNLRQNPVLQSGGRVNEASGGDSVSPLSPEMAINARIIIQVGREMRISNYGIVIALATAAQESHLKNIDYGDRDSIGLFQQRPSSGWGSVSQIRDPRYAARAFFGGPNSPTPGSNPGLLDIPRWQHMTLTDAAQAVQRSAFPDAYAKWEVSAWNWFFELT